MLNSAKLWTLKFYYWSKFYLQLILYQKLRGMINMIMNIRQWISVGHMKIKKNLMFLNVSDNRLLQTLHNITQ